MISQAKQAVISTSFFCKALFAGTFENKFALKEAPCVRLSSLCSLASNRDTTVGAIHIKARTDKTKVSIQTFIKFQAIQHLLSKLGSSTDKTKP